MNALVTGGGGFLGTRLIELLLDRGHPVRAFGRRPYPHLAELGVECIQGDVRDREAVLQACIGADVVFHAAAKAGIWGRRTEFHEINAKGTATVVQACLEAKITRLVFTSSPSVAMGEDDIEGGDESLPYPDRYLADYPASKAQGERMVLEADGWEMSVEEPGPRPGAPPATRVVRLRTCALRPHLIWGPGDPHLIPRLVVAAEQGKLRQVGDGTNRVDLTYVDNAAHAHILAAEELGGDARCGGRAYFIGDAEPVVLWDWINEILAQSGIPPVEKRLSYGAARRLGAVLELIHRALPRLGEPRMTRFLALALAKSHWFLHDAARRDFGYEPLVGPERGMHRMLTWLRESRRPCGS